MQDQGIFTLKNIITKSPQPKGEEDPVNESSIHDDYSYQDFFTACQKDEDIDTILQIINNLKDININQSDSFRNTPLLLASKNNNLELIKLLLTKFKADPNIENIADEIPLHWSVKNGNIEAIKILLDHGSNMHHISFKEETPLQIAQQNQNQDAIQLMTKVKQSKSDEILVMIQEGNIQQIKGILWVIENHYIVMNQKNERKMNFIQYALSFKQIPVVKLLIEEGAQVNKRDKNHQTIVHSLFKSSNKICDQELIDALVKNDADFTLRDLDGNTPTMLVLQNDSQKDDLVDKIIKACQKCILNQSFLKSLTISNCKNMNALQYAFKSKLFKIIGLLLDFIPDLNIRIAPNSEYLIFSIFRTENEELIKKFISLNSDLNLQNHNGDTILHILCRDSQLNHNLIKQVLEKGVDQLIQNKDGEIPLFIVAKMKNNNLDLLELLLQLRYLTQDLTKLQKIVDKQGNNLKNILSSKPGASKLLQELFQQLDEFQQEFNEIKRTSHISSPNMNNIFYNAIQKQDIKSWELLKRYGFKLFLNLIDKSQKFQDRSKISHRGDTLRKLIYSPNPKIIAIFGYIVITIWDLESKNIIFHTIADSINEARFSPDGKKILIEENRCLKIFDIYNNKEIQTISITQQDYWLSTLSLNSDKLAFYQAEKIYIQDIQSGNNEVIISQRLDLSGNSKLFFTKDSSKLYVTTFPIVRLFDTQRGYLIENYRIESHIFLTPHIKYLHSKNYFLLCTIRYQLQVQFYNISTKKITKNIISDDSDTTVNENYDLESSFALSPDEKKLFGYGIFKQKTRLKLLDVHKQIFVKSQWLDKQIKHAEFLACGKNVALLGENQIYILNIFSWSLSSYLTLCLPYRYNLEAPHLIPNSNSLITIQDKKLISFNGISTQLEQEINLKGNQESKLIMQDGGKYFITAEDHMLSIWDAKTFKIVKELKLDHLNNYQQVKFQSNNTVYYYNTLEGWYSIDIFKGNNTKLNISSRGYLSKDCQKLATYDMIDTIKIFEFSTGKCLKKYQLKKRNLNLNCAEFVTPKKLMIIFLDSLNLYIWDSDSNKLVQTISLNILKQNDQNFIDPLCIFLKEGKFFAAYTRYSEQILGSVQTGEIIEHVPPSDDYSFGFKQSFNGQYLISRTLFMNLNAISNDQLQKFENFDYDIKESLISLIENKKYFPALQILNQVDIKSSILEDGKVLKIAEEKNARTVIELIQELIKQKKSGRGQCCNVF